MSKKNRKTGTRIELWDGEVIGKTEPHRYWLMCIDHEEEKGFDRSREARDTIARPFDWCPKCGAGEAPAAKVAEVDDEDLAIDIIVEAPLEAKTERLAEYGTLTKGDDVKIKGMQGTFTVIYIDVFEDTTRQPEVTVIGGSGGHSSWRTFTIDKIKQQSRRRKTA